MRDSAWTIRNVNDLTRRAFEVLAARNGLNEADFLQLLLVEYATSKVLGPESDSNNATATGTATQEKPSVQTERQRPSSRPEEDRLAAEEPTSEEIADWIRRLDSKKSEKKLLQLSNHLFRTWLAGSPGKQPIASASSATAA